MILQNGIPSDDTLYSFDYSQYNGDYDSNYGDATYTNEYDDDNGSGSGGTII